MNVTVIKQSESVVTVIQRYAFPKVTVIPTFNYGYLSPKQLTEFYQ